MCFTYIWFIKSSEQLNKSDTNIIPVLKGEGVNREGSEWGLSRVKEVKNYKKQVEGLVHVKAIWVC